MAGNGEAEGALAAMVRVEDSLRQCKLPAEMARLELARSQAYRTLGNQNAQYDAILRGQQWILKGPTSDSNVSLYLDFAAVELRHDLGDLTQAEEGYFQLLRRAQDLKDCLKQVDIWLALASFFLDIGEWDAAAECLSSVISLIDSNRKIVDEMHPAVARAEMARVLTRQDKPERAGTLLGEAHRLSTADKGMPRQWHLVLQSQAEFLLKQGALPDALALFKSVVEDPDAEKEARWRARQGMAQALAFMGSHREARSIWWSAVEELGKQYRELSPRFYQLVSLGQRSGLYQAWIEGLVHGWEVGGRLTYSEGEFVPGKAFVDGPISADDLLAAVESISSQLLSENLLNDRNELSLRSSGYRRGNLSGLSEGFVSGADLRARLTPGQVAYFFVPLVDTTLVLKVERAGVEVFPLPVRGDTLAREVAGVVADLNGRRIGIESRLDTLGQALLQHIQWPKDPDTPIAFILLGELDKLPVSTLRIGGKYVVEYCAPYYVPSLKALTALRPREFIPGQGDGALGVAFGDGLEWAGAEVALLARAGIPTRVLDSYRATRSEVMGGMTRSRLVHIAAHGVGPFRDNRGQRPGTISLADGDLSARDIQSLDLSAELVVFGACESGLGLRHMWESSWGSLQRAALEAHAGAVMATRWKAHDEVSFVLMEQFYADLVDQGAALALAHAQRMLIASLDSSKIVPYRGLKRVFGRPDVNYYLPSVLPYSDPSGWGAFSLAGYPGRGGL